MRAHRGAAIAALALGVAAAVLAVAFVIRQFPSALFVAAGLGLSAVALWYALVRTDVVRVVVLGLGILALIAASSIVVAEGDYGGVPLAAAIVAASAFARVAFATRAQLADVPAPQRPFLFLNPRSGGGKAVRFALADEASARGIEPVTLGPADELEALVREAVAAGADGLAMAGGDGSQAIVAAIAAEYDLPYACIPSGTRNHFALDLGVDRDDVVGALDAFVDGGERRVDLAEVNGRVFVNNVSLGVYAEAVQRDNYREAKLRTLLATLSERQSGAAAGSPELRWRGPGGHEHSAGIAILVSNNRYRLGHAIGSGTRPRIDDGLLGITIAGYPRGREGSRGEPRPQRPWREWSTSEFRVDAEGPVPAGVDGEAVTLEPPLRFRIRAGALRVRIARKHPGASPSALMPDHLGPAVQALWLIARGGDPGAGAVPGP